MILVMGLVHAAKGDTIEHAVVGGSAIVENAEIPAMAVAEAERRVNEAGKRARTKREFGVAPRVAGHRRVSRDSLHGARSCDDAPRGTSRKELGI